jgi:hypothetical protein
VLIALFGVQKEKLGEKKSGGESFLNGKPAVGSFQTYQPASYTVSFLRIAVRLMITPSCCDILLFTGLHHLTQTKFPKNV